MTKKLPQFLIVLCFIFIYSSKKNYAQKLQKIGEYTTKDGLLGNSISSIEKDANGFYWFKTNNGICRWNGRNFFKEHTTPNTKTILKINQDSLAKVWDFYEDTRMYITDANSNIYKLKNQGTLKPIYNSNNLNDILEFNDLIKYHLGKKDTSVAFFLNNAFNGRYVYKADEGFYCIDYGYKFVYLTKNRLIKKVQLPNAPLHHFFLINNSFVALNENNGNYLVYDKDSIVYNGSIGYKIADVYNTWVKVQHNKADAVFTTDNILYKLSFSKNYKLVLTKLCTLDNYGKYTCFYYDESKNLLLLGTQLTGFEMYTLSNQNIKHIEQPVQFNNVYAQTVLNNKIVSNIDVYKNYLAKKTPKWEWYLNSAICSVNNTRFLYIYNTYINLIDGKKMTRLSERVNLNNARDYLQTDSALYIVRDCLEKYYDNSSKYLVGNITSFPTFGNKLFAIAKTYKPNTIYAVIGDKLQEIDLYNKNIKTLATGITGEVRNIYNDTISNTLFISTKFNGCFYYKNGFLAKLPFTFNDKTLNCHYVLQDKDGDYWLPTDEGLYVMFKADFLNYLTKTITTITFKKFGKQDGLLSEEFNGGFAGGGLYYKDSMYLGGMQGTVVFHPNIKYNKKNEAYKLLIDYIKLDDSLITYVTNFTVPPNFKQIHIKADYPFILNENLHIEYRVLGTNDTSWQLLNSNGIIGIKNLRDGSYVVEIKLNNESRPHKSIQFIVAPYWYNTWWAKILFGFLFCSAIYIIFMWQWNSAKNQNLEAVNKSRNNLFETIAHDLRSPINSYIGLADDLKYLIKNRDFDSIDKLGNAIDEKSRNLSLLLSNVLNWSRSENGLVKAEKQVFKVIDIFNDILPIYTDIADFRGINININVPTDATIKSDKNIFSHIIRNLIDNAIKHSDNNSTIKINYTATKLQNITEITNLLQQKQTANLILINKIFRGLEKEEPHSKGLGLGISSIYNSCKLLNGTIELNSENNLVRFKIILPK
jgi:AraC family transcriptional regulator, chitin signaling transcriptional activator